MGRPHGACMLESRFQPAEAGTTAFWQRTIVFRLTEAQSRPKQSKDVAPREAREQNPFPGKGLRAARRKPLMLPRVLSVSERQHGEGVRASWIEHGAFAASPDDSRGRACCWRMKRSVARAHGLPGVGAAIGQIGGHGAFSPG